MKTRFNQSNSAKAYSPNMRNPGASKKRSGRGITAIVLCLLLPPIGLMFLWRKGIFRSRGRMLLSTLVTIEMMVICFMLIPGTELETYLPAPMTPAAVTPAPQSNTLTALSNIEQLIYEQQLAEVIASGGSAEDLMSDEELQQIENAERDAILNTVVYSVYNGAIKYHAKKICGTQTNGRELTVEQAMSEGLAVCANCNPPVWTG